MGATPARLAAVLAERYVIDRELGVGGMATVYLGHDRKHERDVAIKVLHPDLGAARCRSVPERDPHRRTIVAKWGRILRHAQSRAAFRKI